MNEEPGRLRIGMLGTGEAFTKRRSRWVIRANSCLKCKNANLAKNAERSWWHFFVILPDTGCLVQFVNLSRARFVIVKSYTRRILHPSSAPRSSITKAAPAVPCASSLPSP